MYGMRERGQDEPKDSDHHMKDTAIKVGCCVEKSCSVFVGVVFDSNRQPSKPVEMKAGEGNPQAREEEEGNVY